VTAEEIHKQQLAPKLVQSLPASAPIFDKASFGLAHQPDILAAVEQTGRKTAVLIGLETDVCVAQSAIGLIEQGYRVAVVADATGTPAQGQEIGLNRMRNAGAVIVSTKSLFYEWMRTVEMANRFHRECPNMRDLDGIVL
jgi:nicotinamidase-related amidase